MRMTDYATGFQHAAILTGDMMETLLFYTELGFDVVWCGSLPDTGAAVNFVKLGDLCLEIIETENPPHCYGSVEHLAINVTDIQGAYDLICSRGLNNLEDEIHTLPFWENGVKYFCIEGPNKEKIEFNQYL